MFESGLKLGFQLVKAILNPQAEGNPENASDAFSAATTPPDSEYSNSTPALENTDGLGNTARLFLEDSAYLLDQLKNSEQDQRSFNDPSDLAYSLADNSGEFHEKLDDLEAGLAELHGLAIEDKALVIQTLMNLGGDYLNLAGSQMKTPEEAALVREELGELSGKTFGILARYADEDEDGRMNQLVPLLEGYELLALGKVDEAAERLEEVKDLFPEAADILQKLDDDKTRMANLAVLEAWKAYNREGQAADWNESTGALGLAQGLFNSTDQTWYSTWGQALNETYNPFHEAKSQGRHFVPDSAQVYHQKHYQHWELEKSLVAEVERKLQGGEATTIRKALEQIKGGSDNEKMVNTATYYLDSSAKNIEGEIRPYFVDLGDEIPPSAGLARKLLGESWDYHARYGFAETPLKIYSLLQSLSDNKDIIRVAADQQWEVEAALGGDASFGYSAEKLIHNLNPKFVGEAGVLFVAGSIGNLARLGALARLEAAGIHGYKATALAFGAEVVAEGSTLWAINTGRAAAFNNVEQVFTPEHLAKSYGADLLMIGGLKGFGRVSRAVSPRLAYGLGMVAQDGIQLSAKGRMLTAGLSHLSGMTGMVGTSRVNQWLGLREAPMGGWMEGLVNDVFMYWEFALAHKVADGLTMGKMSKVQHGMHSEVAVRESRLHAKGYADRLGYAPGTPAREQFVFRMMNAQLSHPGFSSGKFVRMLERGDLDASRKYLKERKLYSSLSSFVTPAPEKTGFFQSEGFREFTQAFAAPLPFSILGPHTLLGDLIGEILLREKVKVDWVHPGMEELAPARAEKKSEPFSPSQDLLLQFEGVLPVLLESRKPISLVPIEEGSERMSRWRVAGSDGDKILLEKVPPEAGKKYLDQTFYEGSPQELKVRAPYGRTDYFSEGTLLNLLPAIRGAAGKPSQPNETFGFDLEGADGELYKISTQKVSTGGVLFFNPGAVVEMRWEEGPGEAPGTYILAFRRGVGVQEEREIRIPMDGTARKKFGLELLPEGKVEKPKGQILVLRSLTESFDENRESLQRHVARGKKDDKAWERIQEQLLDRVRNFGRLGGFNMDWLDILLAKLETAPVQDKAWASSTQPIEVPVDRSTSPDLKVPGTSKRTAEHIVASPWVSARLSDGSVLPLRARWTDSKVTLIQDESGKIANPHIPTGETEVLLIPKRRDPDSGDFWFQVRPVGPRTSQLGPEIFLGKLEAKSLGIDLDPQGKIVRFRGRQELHLTIPDRSDTGPGGKGTVALHSMGMGLMALVAESAKQGESVTAQLGDAATMLSLLIGLGAAALGLSVVGKRWVYGRGKKVADPNFADEAKIEQQVGLIRFGNLSPEKKIELFLEISKNPNLKDLSVYQRMAQVPSEWFREKINLEDLSQMEAQVREMNFPGVDDPAHLNYQRYLWQLIEKNSGLGTPEKEALWKKLGF